MGKIGGCNQQGIPAAQDFSHSFAQLLGDFRRLGAHHYRQELEIPDQGALEEWQFNFEGMLMIVSHPGETVPQGF